MEDKYNGQICLGANNEKNEILSFNITAMRESKTENNRAEIKDKGRNIVWYKKPSVLVTIALAILGFIIFKVIVPITELKKDTFHISEIVDKMERNQDTKNRIFEKDIKEIIEKTSNLRMELTNQIINLKDYFNVFLYNNNNKKKNK